MRFLSSGFGNLPQSLLQLFYEESFHCCCDHHDSEGDDSIVVGVVVDYGDGRFVNYLLEQTP